MIFVTVGSQMPFDRLIKAMDQWATTQKEPIDIFAQIGSNGFIPQKLRFANAVSPKEFNELARSARLIVAHAGMGSILTALEFGKPLVLMPRRGTLHETRNDHQVATAQWLENRAGIYVAMTEVELPATLEKALQADTNQHDKISSYASPLLLNSLSDFINSA
ncbi:MAG: glycosyltransferase [Pseudomonadota bacterium]